MSKETTKILVGTQIVNTTKTLLANGNILLSIEYQPLKAEVKTNDN